MDVYVSIVGRQSHSLFGVVRATSCRAGAMIHSDTPANSDPFTAKAPPRAHCTGYVSLFRFLGFPSLLPQQPASDLFPSSRQSTNVQSRSMSTSFCTWQIAPPAMCDRGLNTTSSRVGITRHRIFHGAAWNSAESSIHGLGRPTTMLHSVRLLLSPTWAGRRQKNL